MCASITYLRNAPIGIPKILYNNWALDAEKRKSRHYLKSQVMNVAQHTGYYDIFNRGRFAKSLRELKNASVSGLPSAVFGPYQSIFESSLFKKLESNKDYLNACNFLHSQGYSKSLRKVKIPQQVDETLAILESFATPGSCNTVNTPPKIQSISSYDDGLDCCSLVQGKTIKSAEPGTFVRINGTGFSSQASDNTVSFDDTRASILKSDDESIVVMVPIVGLNESESDLNLKTGKTIITVATPGGTATLPFEISDFTNTDSISCDVFIQTMERILAKVNGRIAMQADFFKDIAKQDASGRTGELLQRLPLLSSLFARSTHVVPFALSSVKGEHSAKFTRAINGIISNSGFLQDAQLVEASLDDPSSQLLFGSGLIEAICTVVEYAHKAVIVLVAVLTVLTILLLVTLFVLIGLGPAGVIIDVAIITVVISILTVILEPILIFITVVEVVHLAYEAGTWLAGKLVSGWKWLTGESGTE